MQFYSLVDVILPPVTKNGRFEILGQQYPGEGFKPYCLSCSNPLQIKGDTLQVKNPQTVGVY
jgi:hypothetical protein